MYFKLFALLLCVLCADAFACTPLEYSLYGSFAQATTTYEARLPGRARDDFGDIYSISANTRMLALKSGWGAGFGIAYPLNTFAAIGAELKYSDTTDFPDTQFPEVPDSYMDDVRFNNKVLSLGPNFIFRYPIAKLVDIGTSIGLSLGRHQMYARDISLMIYKKKQASAFYLPVFSRVARGYFKAVDLVPVFSARPFVSLRLSPYHPVRVFAAYELFYAGTRRAPMPIDAGISTSHFLRPSEPFLVPGQYNNMSLYPSHVTNIAHMFLIGMSVAN